MSWFALFDRKGDYQGAVQSLDGYPAAARRRALPIEREPGDFERVDRKTAALITDEAAAINHRAGADHIAAMRERKVWQAMMIVAGNADPAMLLVREASARGITATEMAAIIFDKIAAQEALELERQAASLPKNQEV